MATQLFFLSGTSDYSTGNNDAKLNGSTSGWSPRILSASRGGSATNMTVSTVAGTTNGIEIGGTQPLVFYSLPLAADVTISGSVTWNLRASESSMSANAAINGILEVVDGTDGTITLIDKTARTTELGTSEGAENFSETPAAGVACKRGDRLRVRVFADDAGTMASGFTVTFWCNGPTGGASGDSYLTLTEDLSFIANSDPGGTKLYLTDTASAVSTSSVDLEAWTDVGDGATSGTTNSANGWLSPIHATTTGGGTALDWFTRPLTAFTLSGGIYCNIRARENNISANASVRVEIHVVDEDGTNPTLFAATSYGVELASSETATLMLVSGDDLSVDDGQRLRIRVLFDDSPGNAMATGFSLIVFYNGVSDGQTGDSYVILTQDVTEFDSTDEIEVPFLDSGPALYAPTLIPDQLISLGLLDASPALYAPTVTPKNTISLGLIDASPALYAPTLTPKNTISLGLLDASPALYAPTVIQDQFITLGLLDGAPALYAPSLSHVVTLPLLDASPALYAPSLVHVISLPLLDAVSALYAPTLESAGGVQSIDLDLLDSGPALYAPSLSFVITVPFLDAAPALYAPTLTPKNLISLGLLDAGPALYAPTVMPDQFVTLGLLESTPALYAPSLSFVINLPLLDASPALYAPTLSPKNTITLSLLDAGPALFSPTLNQGQTVFLGFIDGSPALFAPTLIQDQFVVLALLDSGPALYAPTLIQDQFVTLGLLDSGSALYAPTLTAFKTLVLGLLDSNPALYAPTLAPGATTVTIGFLDSGAELYAPLVSQPITAVAGDVLNLRPESQWKERYPWVYRGLRERR